MNIMPGSSRSSSASGLSRKRCGCGDEVVVFTTDSRAKNLGKRFRRCPNWKDVNRSFVLFEWVEDDERFVDLSCGGGYHASELLIENTRRRF
ncbi:hypothetical protein SESBI_20871 [Sesbania bispinosa]|nr:hypothetical protein SESBI_20871 [Sesbania bispinosa]